VRIPAILLLLALFWGSAAAEPVADFYKGKTVTMLVGGSAGGGYDSWARAIARFLGRHVPGTPSVVVRDMPGAGGTTALNHLYFAAEKDGSVIALVPNNTPLEPLFGTEEARYDSTRLDWLGTPSIEMAVLLVWHDVPVDSVADLKARITTMGSSGALSQQAFYTRLLNDTLGTKLKLINGYQGLNDIFLAMERGEVEGFPNVFMSSLAATRPHWLPQRLAKPILQYGPERLKELPEVPFAPDLLVDADDILLMQAALAPMALGRPLVMPPGVPAERLAAMRRALADCFADAEFVAAAEKSGLAVNAPLSGERLQEVIARAYATPPRIVARLRRINNP
jgi:tripartite-type tricarboxylate transporter receptor subunit TctC